MEATLLRLLDTEDLCIGKADGNRSERGLSESTGMCLNLLLLRLRLNSSQQFQEALTDNRRKAYGAMANLAPTVMVGVFQGRTPDWVACVLTITRIGAVYVPLDVNTTVSWLTTLVADCQPTAIVVNHATSREAATSDPRHECCIINVAIIPASATETSLVQTTVADSFVVLYTSGTTGTPKGVHSALGFDLGFGQCLLALASGGTLVVVPRRLRGGPAASSKLITQEIITHTGAGPSEYSSWIHLPELRLRNAYGLSEATMGITDTVLSLGKPVPDHVPVGSAMATRSDPVLDDDAEPVPPGAAGQICIGDAGGMIGYLDRDELTAGKSIVNRILKAANGSQQKVAVTTRGEHPIFYVRPAAISPVQTLPLAVNGKLDRSVIQMPVTGELGSTCKAYPSGGSGDSMLLIKLQGEISSQMGVALQVIQLFGNSILGEMAAIVQDAADSDAAQVDRVEEMRARVVDPIRRPVILTGASRFVYASAQASSVAIHDAFMRVPESAKELWIPREGQARRVNR
ncbi:hypothetical protein DL770_005489 [Monosporascus sp. CRB-9-2]|nr:hypothetical protein DL770_005489 [Monosporascus sp. CRB-9-2]